MDVINYLYESKNLEYYDLNDKYSGYDYNIKKTDNDINLDINVDVSQVNLSKMVLDGYIDENYVNSKGLKLGGIKYFYREKGAICKD